MSSQIDLLHKFSKKSEISPYNKYGTFCCDYCGKTKPSSELHKEKETDYGYYYDVGALGKGVIKRHSKQYETEMCGRCHKIHNIAGIYHFLLGLFVVIWIGHKFNDILAVAILGLIPFYIIYRINWLIIKFIFHTRRKPKGHFSI